MADDEQMDRLFRYYKASKSITYDQDVPNGTRVLVVPDIQLPFVDEPLLRAFMKFTADYRPDTIITVGDFMDCVTPETRVLTYDLRWVPAKELTIGTELLAFDENSPGIGQSGKGLSRKMRKSIVERVGLTPNPVFALHMEDGSILRSTAGHRWLGWRSSKNRATPCWLRTDEIIARIKSGRPVLLNRPIKPWTVEHDYDSGFIAAAFDGEGHITFHSNANNFARLAFTQRPGSFLDRVENTLNRKGFNTKRMHHSGRGTTQLVLGGGMWAQAEFIGRFNVPRFTSKWTETAPVDGYQLRGTKRVRAVGFEYEGIKDIVPIQTSTGTYIAEGFASHNCYEVSDFDKRPERLFNLEDEMKMATSIIDDLHARAAPNHQLFWVDGNHEERVQRIIWRKAQQFSHLVQDLPEAMNLDALTNGHVRYGRHIDYLGFVITHGTVVRQHSAYTAKAMIDKYRSSGASGHTHRMGSHSITDHKGTSHTWYEVGCLCRKDLEYTKTEPNWQSGFLIGSVWGNVLYPQLIRVIESGKKRGFMALGSYYEV